MFNQNPSIRDKQGQAIKTQKRISTVKLVPTKGKIFNNKYLMISRDTVINTVQKGAKK